MSVQEPLQVVGVGMATLDVLIRLQDMPTWEHGTRIKSFGLDGGGPVGTAIVAAARLGARAGFVGTAGKDEAAESQLRSLVACGVDLSRLARRDEPEDQIVVVYVNAETGERTFAGVETARWQPLAVEELDRAYITSAEYLHLDGFHAEAALQAAQWMKEAGKAVVLDGHKTHGPIHDRLRALIPYVDILISGSGFVQGLTGQTDVFAASKAALDLGPRVIVQTEGEDGSYTTTADDHFHTPAFKVDVIDTTGAGDVFHGAYIVGLLHRWNVRQIAQFASAVSAIKCTKLGGRFGIPNYQDTLAFLAQRGIALE